jgi:hypothetical protein
VNNDSFACQSHGVFANPTRIAADTAAISFWWAFCSMAAGEENYDSSGNSIEKVVQLCNDNIVMG